VIITTLAFFCGVLALQFLPNLPSFFITVIIFLLLIILIIVWFFIKYCNDNAVYKINPRLNHLFPILVTCCGISIIAIVGFLYACLRAERIDRWHLSPAIEKKKIIITGLIDSLPVYKKNFTVFDVVADAMVVVDDQANMTSLSPSFTRLPQTKFRLSWYHHYPFSHCSSRQQLPNQQQFQAQTQCNQKSQLSPPEPSPLFAGDRWQFMVRLKRPHSMLNPGGSDHEKYLWQHQIRALGTVIGDVNQSINQNNQNHNHRLFVDNVKFEYFILRLRQNLKIKITAALERQPLTAMINAVVLGDQSGISKKQWQIFRDTGSSYLMAIAGLHICLAASVVFLLVQFLWRLMPRLVLCLPAHHAAAIAGLFAAIIYSVLSGFSIPTQRALIMLSVFTFTLLARRHTNAWYTLCLALLIILIVDPFAVLNDGFWLSFIAVALIFYVSVGRLQLSHSWWRRYSRMQWAITLGLAPITLMFFSQTSLITFVANIIAMPGVCSLVVPLSILGSLLLLLSPTYGAIILLLAEKLLELIWWWLQWLATFSQFNWQQSVVNWWTVILAMIGVLILLTPRGFYGKWVGILWLLPLIFYQPLQLKEGEFWLNVLDVGQGLATVIQTRNHVLVYDTGPKFMDGDAGENVMIPFLRTFGINSIDMMVISHGDIDHSGGVDSIVAMMQVNKILASEVNKLSPFVMKRMPQQQVQNCHRGQEWQWDGVNFKILHPPLGVAANGNDTSCVLRVAGVNGSNSILLLGDVTKAQEKLLLQNTSLATTVVVAAHHGSATSSSSFFVKATNPQYVIFSAGYKNRFHFPAAKVVERYLQQGSSILSTFDTGAITFKFKPAAVGSKTANQQHEILLYRQLVRRYWHGVTTGATFL